MPASFGYSEAVFSKSRLANAAFGDSGAHRAAAGLRWARRAAPDAIAAPQVFYTVTGEIALARREPRVAALQYAAAAHGRNRPRRFWRARAKSPRETLQPSLTAAVAARWISLDPEIAGRAPRGGAARRSRSHRIAAVRRSNIASCSRPRRAARMRNSRISRPSSSAAATCSARARLADRLAAAFPESAAALRLQGFAALRADDPAAAVRKLHRGAQRSPARASIRRATRGTRDLRQGLWRARILSGDSAGAARASRRRSPSAMTTPANLLDYALLLLAAQQNEAAIAELESLVSQADIAPVALRLLGLVEFQEDKLDAAARRFTELLATRQISRRFLLLSGLDRGAARRPGKGAAPVRAGAGRRQRGRPRCCGRATSFRRTARRRQRRRCSII